MTTVSYGDKPNCLFRGLTVLLRGLNVSLLGLTFQDLCLQLKVVGVGQSGRQAEADKAAALSQLQRRDVRHHVQPPTRHLSPAQHQLRGASQAVRHRRRTGSDSRRPVGDGQCQRLCWRPLFLQQGVGPMEEERCPAVLLSATLGWLFCRSLPHIQRGGSSDKS